MAAKYRKIDPRIWSDESFTDLIPREKLIALYAITAQSNRCGLFRFSLAMASEQTGIETDSYAKGFGRVCDSLGWKYDNRVRVLFIPTWWKYNPPENAKHLQGCLEDLHDLPQTKLLAEFARTVGYIPDHSRDSFAIAMQIAMAYQEQKQEQERKQKNTSAGADVSADADAVQTSPPNSDNGSEKAGGVQETTKATRRKPASGNHHELIRLFCDTWKARHGVPYTFLEGKDGRHIKWILAALLEDMVEASEIVKAYIGDDDAWLVDKRHPLGILVSNFNKYRARKSAGAIGVPNGRHHANNKRTAAARGEYVSSLQVRARKLGGGGGASGATENGAGVSTLPEDPSADPSVDPGDDGGAVVKVRP